MVLKGLSVRWAVILIVVWMLIPTAATHAGDVHPPGKTPVLRDEVFCEGRPYVVLLVDPAVKSGIQMRLTRFQRDLCLQGYGVIITTLDPIANPYHVREHLQQLAQSYSLAGTILIGNVPHAYQWIDELGVSYEAISMQYYADLDGTFKISPDYVSPGGHDQSFDIHTGETDWEIWVGVLPIYLGDTAKTIDAINGYLDKNHTYRTSGTTIPSAYMEVNEHFVSDSPAEDAAYLDGMINGDYAWSPLAQQPSSGFYFWSTDPTRTVTVGIEQMSVGVADFTVYSAHGDHDNNGMHSLGWIESHPTRTIYYWAGGCAVGNIDEKFNWLASAVYSDQSEMLLVQGTTNNSGGLGTNMNGYYGANIATAMVNGAGAGDAVKNHVNVPLIWPWIESPELHTALIILAGDPTLTLSMSQP